MYAYQFLMDIRQLRKIRAILGLTQKQLATMSGVSQSLIAKIETGRIEPSYRCVMQIYSAIAKYENEMQEKKTPRVRTAGEVCNRNLISFRDDDDLITVAKTLTSKGITQAPVLDANGRVIGTVRDARVMEHLNYELPGNTVKDVMEPPLPIVDASISVSTIIPIVKQCYGVLVSENGHIIGIITPHDLLYLLENTE